MFTWIPILLLGSVGATLPSVVEQGATAVTTPELARSASESRIVAGWSAQDGQIPHQVSVRMVDADGGVSSCGGSVIHHEWILTAAHCVANRYTFIIRAGLTNLTTTQYILEANRRYIHPEYYEPSAGVQTADIALIGLDNWLPYGTYLQPCRLQNSQQKNQDYTGVRMTASGYGMTDDSWNGGTTSETLNWVYLLGISNAQCQGIYGSIVGDPTICVASYNDTAQSSCQGDSGGPLTFIDFDGKPSIAGVASFVAAAGCNSIFPSGWVRPGHYHDWFYEITGLDFDWEPYGV